ncbi:AarF/ABC1/UbiB kinase family protein [Synechococcales cyanobacterium C]|uniref:AarF/ABC1/UbiB kinase family protein n=2 Tax=Petrachloros TaxID=2918834 RepID=A0A8K2A8R1_9CYAN|nr:AarF/ABC1/UbiB kinase family protein [Petrachloros mirabilis ULC683]
MRRLLAGSKTDEPQLPPPAVLRKILTELGPVYVKLGQLLSTRPDLLPTEYIHELSLLQSAVPSVPWSEIQPMIRQQLQQPLESVFQSIESVPVAAGSIGQTHRAILLDGREVAVKVQRPGIEGIIAQDIALIRFLADLATRTDLAEDYDLKALANEFAQALQEELNFNREASYADQLRRNFATSSWFDPDRLVVPVIEWDFTSEKLLVMEWLNGEPLLSAELKGQGYGDDPQVERRAISTLLFRAFFQQLYVDGFFHADPHPGNLFYLGQGRIALLDFGMVGRLDPNTQGILTEMLLAIVDMDAQRCSQLTLRLAESVGNVNLVMLETDYERLLRRYYNRNLSEINFSQVFYEILQVARNNKIRLPSNMGLYAKTMANLEGVARAFDPEINLLDEIKPLITDLFRQQLLGEAPLQAMLRTALDLKNLGLQSPRQLEMLLDRVTSETLKWNISLPESEPLRRTLDSAANRLSFSIVVGALIMGAATVVSQAQTTQLNWISNALFIAACLLGLWLLVSILRSGQLR